MENGLGSNLLILSGILSCYGIGLGNVDRWGGCAMAQKQVTVMTSLFGTPFLAFLIVVIENNWYFWNSGIKLDKIGMFCK